MRILIGCECSGTIRDTFRGKGHYAISCDLQPDDNGETAYHYQGDLFDLLCPENEWDLVIVHPPCTFLSSSGLHWNTRPEGIASGRPQKTLDALAFVERIWAGREFIPKLCLENPKGCISTRSSLGKASQYIQPYEYGEDASKSTGLWLHNLPLLKPTKRFPGRLVRDPTKGYQVERWSNQTDSGQNALPPSDSRAKQRSKTYQGWADAMAYQWDNLK